MNYWILILIITIIGQNSYSCFLYHNNIEVFLILAALMTATAVKHGFDTGYKQIFISPLGVGLYIIY
jgi:predicted CDP-diglyceride synthetase/phosphatidate cytidylyltransferase